MLKAISRWFYMKTHHEELLKMANYVRRDASGLAPKVGLVKVGEIQGALYSLTTLDLLDRG